jgi:hypothetical protein
MEDKMGKACGTYEDCAKEEKCIQGYGGETSRKETTWKNYAGIDGMGWDELE